MNFSVTYKTVDNAINALKMFELRKLVTVSILEGSFHTARVAQKELAKSAVADFDTFRTLPNVKITNVPFKDFLVMGFRSIGYKLYKFFTGKSREEKLLSKMSKQYQKANILNQIA